MKSSDFAMSIIALFALVVSILTLMQQWLSSISTWKIADEANKISKEANSTAEEALKVAKDDFAISLHEHKTKILPELKGYLWVLGINLENSDTDLIHITFRNETQSKVTIDSIDLFGTIFIANHELLQLPCELLFHEELELTINFNEAYRKKLLDSVKLSYVDNGIPLDETFELIVLKQVEASRILIKLRNNLGDIYSSQMRYNSEVKYFQGHVKEIRSNERV